MLSLPSIASNGTIALVGFKLDFSFASLHEPRVEREREFIPKFQMPGLDRRRRYGRRLLCRRRKSLVPRLPAEARRLRARSSITQNRDVAKAFSHRPSLMSMSQSEAGETWSVRHDGVTPGYLYVVAEEIGSGDARPHPHPVNVSRWEWLTNRDMELRFIEETRVMDGQNLRTTR